MIWRALPFSFSASFGRGCLSMAIGLLLFQAIAFADPTERQQSRVRATASVELGARTVSLQIASHPESRELLSLRVERGKFERLNIFELSSPRRVVIDLYGDTPHIRKEIAIDNGSVIDRVRMGAHHDKLRIVADLRPAFQQDFSWSIEKNQLLIEFPVVRAAESAFGVVTTTPFEPPKAESEARAEPLVPVLPSVSVLKVGRLSKPASPAAPAPLAASELLALMDLADLEMRKGDAPTREPTESGVGKKQPGEAEIPESQKIEVVPAHQKIVPDSLPAPSEDDSELDDAGREEQHDPAELQAVTKVAALTPPTDPVEIQELRGIRFARDGEDSGSLLLLELAQRPQYTLSRKGTHRFQISIPGCSLAGSHLALPYFPPHDATGFTMVRAMTSQGDLIVEVQVDRDTHVASFTRGNFIVLRSETNAG